MTRASARTLPAAAAEGGIESLLHTACVRAGAGAALQVGLDRLPLLRPLLPQALRREGTRESAEDIQRALVAEIYRRYGLTPAGWEVEGVLAVAETQAVLSPLATREGLKTVLKAWLPGLLGKPLLRYTPLEPLVTATVRAVAITWAAGRYADSVCRLRKAGADWLPAPLTEALTMAPRTLRTWSAEALSLAMPPLKFAAALGRRVTSAGGALAAVGLGLPGAAARAATPRPAKRAATKKAATKRAAARTGSTAATAAKKKPGRSRASMTR